MLEIGSLVDGKYKILNKIGQGGMSVVYLAMNERANKQWAIKEVRKDGKQNFETVRQNLVAETDILKKLSHPHLPSIIDVIDRDDSFLIVMDYIEGRPLSDKLKHGGAQPQEKVVEWAKQICDVLGYLHSRRPPIIYRDMKPSNVMLKPDGNIMIIDFGTAREYKSQNIEDTTCLGTQGYAAPEQYGGHGQTDARTDIYCLGATMYHLVTGHNPCLPPYEIRPIRLWNPELSSGLEEIILKCTQKDPNNRYQNCAELMYALDHYKELDLDYKRKQNRRLRLFGASAIAALVFAIGAIGFRVAETSSISSNYDAYVQYGKSTEEDTSLENFQKAISLDASRGDAYFGILDKFLDDDNFSKDEASKMTAILGNISSGSRNNEEYLKNNKEDYDEFCYQMGLAYYYYYESDGNKSLSQTWFEKAAESTTLDSKKIARSEKLLTIAKYYSVLSNPDKAGDTEFTYKDYWNNLSSALEGNIVEEDNARTALVMYREAASQISINGLKFKQAGVSQRALDDMLDDIESHLSTDFKSDKKEYADEIKEVKEEVSYARQQIETYYSDQEANLTNEDTDTDSSSTNSDGGTSNAKS